MNIYVLNAKEKARSFKQVSKLMSYLFSKAYF